PFGRGEGDRNATPLPGGGGNLSVVGAVGFETVGRAGHQSVAATAGALAYRRHANGRIDLRAQAAENAFGEVELGESLAGCIVIGDGAGWTNPGGGAGIFPIRPINFRFSASPAGEFGRCFRIAGGDNANLQALTKGLKHKLTIGP